MKKTMLIAVALALAAALSAPAAAQEKSEVSFGGFVAFSTWFVDTEEPIRQNDNEDLWGRYEDKDLMWSLETIHSRLNATFKREDFTGFMEIRPNNGSFFRHWYGEWDFGPGYLLIGQTWYPSYMHISSSVGPPRNEAPAGGGSPALGGDTANCSGRAPMIRLRFPFTMGQFTFAMIDPKGGNVPWDDWDGKGSSYDNQDFTLPHLEAKLNLNTGPLAFNILGGWRQYGHGFRDDDTLTETEADIDSYIIAANAKFTGGPFSLALAGWMAENPVEYGWFGPNAKSGNLPVNDLNDFVASGMDYPRAVIYKQNGSFHVYDTDGWGAYINAKFKVNDMVGFAAGGGMMELEGEYAAPVKQENEVIHWFVNATITVAEGFTLTPEIGQWDFKSADYTDANGVEASQDLGDTMYYGINWKMTF